MCVRACARVCVCHSVSEFVFSVIPRHRRTAISLILVAASCMCVQLCVCVVAHVCLLAIAHHLGTAILLILATLLCIDMCMTV